MAAWTATDGAMAGSWTAVAIAVALAAAGGFGLLRTDRELRGTTLLAPWRWACFSFTTLASGAAFVAWPSVDLSPAGADHIRYLAGTTTFAPFVALLGAKRPQDRAWQWIVLALLLLLALPSGKAFMFDSGAPPAPHAAWRLLLVILLSSQLANHLPTSFRLSALLACLAQLGWLAGYLPGVANRPSGTWALAGLALATAAIWLVRRPMPRRPLPCRPIDRLWLEFRDAYGALWALRVAERFNASAAMYGWPVRMRWGGLREAEEQEKGKSGRGEQGMAAMRQNLKTLLWRFVSPEWIAERLGDDDPAPGARQL